MVGIGLPIERGQLLEQNMFSYVPSLCIVLVPDATKSPMPPLRHNCLFMQMVVLDILSVCITFQ